MPDLTVRAATAADAAACAALYAPFVTGSAISFEEEPPGADELARRIDGAHVWLVAEEDGVLVGFAYASRHRERAAYRWAADVAVYVDPRRHRAGVGRALYTELLDRLRAAGIRTVCAGVTLPTPRARGCTGRWASSRWARTGGSAGSTAAGTTCAGSSSGSGATIRPRASPTSAEPALPAAGTDESLPARGSLLPAESRGG